MLGLAAAIGAYAWLTSIEGALHRDTSSMGRIRKHLSIPKTPDQPVNILLIGSDTRHGEQARSDTLIIMTVNFKKRQVYLISIPRDTRMEIPGRGTDKINAAYAYGGPELAIRTVERLTRIELNHYVEVDFKGFKKMVDTMGGIEVDVPETINDRTREYRMYIPKGPTHMNGALALNYVRYRHGDSDFKRSERQQVFLRALAGNALRINQVWRLPKLAQIFSQNATTDMNKKELFMLGNFLRGLKPKDMETATLPGRPTMIDNLSYVIPNRSAMSQIFSAVRRGRSLKAMKIDPESGKIENTRNSALSQITVTVQNGSGTEGMGTRAKGELQAQGFKVVSLGYADRYNYPRTFIKASAANISKAETLKKRFFPQAMVIATSDNLRSQVIVVLGSDYASNKEVQQ